MPMGERRQLRIMGYPGMEEDKCFSEEAKKEGGLEWGIPLPCLDTQCVSIRILLICPSVTAAARMLLPLRSYATSTHCCLSPYAKKAFWVPVRLCGIRMKNCSRSTLFACGGFWLLKSTALLLDLPPPRTTYTHFFLSFARHASR